MPTRTVETDLEGLEYHHRQDIQIYTVFVLAILGNIFKFGPRQSEPLALPAPPQKLALPADDEANQEIISPPLPEFKTETLTTEEAKPFAIAILGKVFDRLKNAFERKKKTVKSEHSVFRADFYCQRASREGTANVMAVMQEDARHHALETLLIELDTYYQYQVRPEGLIGGMYTEDLIFMAHRFVDILAEEGKKLSRADLEQQVMTFESQWALQSCDKKGSYMLITSPPGSEKDGYHGIDSETNWSAQESHHTFFYLQWAERTEDGNVVIHTRQIRAWPNIEQLIQIQTQLNNGQKPEVDFENPTLNLIENLIFFDRPDLTPNEMVAEVQKIVYQTQESWTVNPAQLPKVDKDAFWKIQQQLMQLTTDGIPADFYLTTVQPLLEQIPQGLEPDDPYWQSADYQKIIKQMDKAFTYYTLTLDKWVVDHNQNLDFKPKKQNLLDTLKSLPLKILTKRKHKKTDTQMTLVEKIRRLYEIDVRQTVFKEKISKDDQEWYFGNVGNLISLVARLFSLAQCGGLAPFTAPFSIMKASGSIGNFRLNVTLLSPKERMKFFQEIKSQNYVEINLSKKWMVPAEYLKPRKDGTPGCIVKNGVDLGPCDIPLANDPMALTMNQTMFNQYLNSVGRMPNLETEPINQPIEAGEKITVFDRIKDRRPFGLAELFTSPDVTSVGFSQLLAGI